MDEFINIIGGVRSDSNENYEYMKILFDELDRNKDN
jgi:hypothetical protein